MLCLPTTIRILAAAKSESEVIGWSRAPSPGREFFSFSSSFSCTCTEFLILIRSVPRGFRGQVGEESRLSAGVSAGAGERGGVLCENGWSRAPSPGR